MRKSKNLSDFEKTQSLYKAALVRFYFSYKEKEKAIENMQAYADEVKVANERACNAYGVLSPDEKKKVK